MFVEAFEADGIKYRPMEEADIPKLLAFVDIFLRRSWLVRSEYAKDHVKDSWIALDGEKLIGWCMVCGKTPTLHNLIIHPKYRGKGIGSIFIEKLDPQIIRSKKDQATGDPTNFYQSLGYEIIKPNEGKRGHINVMRKREPISVHPADGCNE